MNIAKVVVEVFVCPDCGAYDQHLDEHEHPANSACKWKGCSYPVLARCHPYTWVSR